MDRVGRYLMDQGYTVIPVHPKRKNVWGLTTYTDLAAIPGRVDLVDVFRAPAHCAGHAREVLAMEPPPAAFWMQSGIDSLEARQILDGRVTVIADRCLMVEHRRLAP